MKKTYMLAICAAALAAAVPARGATNPSWVNETPATMGDTGVWSGDWHVVKNGEIALSGENTFTPSNATQSAATPSAGKDVTFTMTARFEAAVTEDSEDFSAEPAGAKSALRLYGSGESLSFQLLTSESGAATWTNVTCSGVTPELDHQYTFQFDLDCTNMTYTVKLVKDSVPTPLKNGDTEKFAFATAEGNPAVSSLSFSGDGGISSLTGSYTDIAKTAFTPAGSNVDVPLEWISANMGSSGIGGLSSDAAAAAALAEQGANGLPRWQSYCLGLNPARADSVILCEAAQAPCPAGKVAVAVKNVNVPASLSGATLTAYLERKTSSGWESVAYAPLQAGETVLTCDQASAGQLEIYRIRVTIE